MDITNRSVGVLLVEDNLSLRRVLRLSMEGVGFNIIEATTGGEALELLTDESIKAVVLDLELPDKMGSKVLEWLQQKGQHNGYPVWVVTSALDPDDVSRQYGSLGSSFLAKPYNPWDLISTLEQLLSKKDKGTR